MLLSCGFSFGIGFAIGFVISCSWYIGFCYGRYYQNSLSCKDRNFLDKKNEFVTILKQLIEGEKNERHSV